VNLVFIFTVPSPASNSLWLTYLIRNKSLKPNWSAILLDLEQLIASSCRRKILKFLWQVDNANVMGLIRKINSAYSQVNPNLLILAQEGIITDTRYGRRRIIKLNRDNPKAILLLQALKLLS